MGSSASKAAKSLRPSAFFPGPGALDPFGKSLRKSSFVKDSDLLSKRIKADGTLDPDALWDDRPDSSGTKSVTRAKEDKVFVQQAEKDLLNRKAQKKAAEEEKVFTDLKEAQLLALKRKGRRASILTSSQGAEDPLGIPG